MDWRRPQNNDLWQGVNGTNNPCPAGYRLPTREEWEAEEESWSTRVAAGAFASPLRLPLTGNRNNSSGSIDNVDSGLYWSGTAGGATSMYLAFTDSVGHPGRSLYRAYGFSVRCIKD